MIVCLIEKHIVGKFVKIISYLLELLDKWLHKTYTPQHMAFTFVNTSPLPLPVEKGCSKVTTNAHTRNYTCSHYVCSV